MQKLEEGIVGQLNNLPGFPPTSQFKLGDYMVEIRVRPAVRAIGDLPMEENLEGDIRVVVEEGAWYIWNGDTWVLAGGGGSRAVVPVHSARRVSSHTTTSALDYTILVDASRGDVIITLSRGSFFNVKKIDRSSNKVRVQPASGPIDGVPFVELMLPWESISVQAEGDEWFII